eukprot:733911_1
MSDSLPTFQYLQWDDLAIVDRPLFIKKEFNKFQSARALLRFPDKTRYSLWQAGFCKASATKSSALKTFSKVYKKGSVESLEVVVKKAFESVRSFPDMPEIYAEWENVSDDNGDTQMKSDVDSDRTDSAESDQSDLQSDESEFEQHESESQVSESEEHQSDSQQDPAPKAGKQEAQSDDDIVMDDVVPQSEFPGSVQPPLPRPFQPKECCTNNHFDGRGGFRGSDVDCPTREYTPCDHRYLAKLRQRMQEEIDRVPKVGARRSQLVEAALNSIRLHEFDVTDKSDQDCKRRRARSGSAPR